MQRAGLIGAHAGTPELAAGAAAREKGPAQQIFDLALQMRAVLHEVDPEAGGQA